MQTFCLILRAAKATQIQEQVTVYRRKEPLVILAGVNNVTNAALL